MIKSYPMAVYLRILANLALGGFFLASAGFKLASPALFIEQIGAFGLLWPPLLPLAAWGLIVLELCAGLAVIANRRWGLWLVIGLPPCLFRCWAMALPSGSTSLAAVWARLISARCRRPLCGICCY